MLLDRRFSYSLTIIQPNRKWCLWIERESGVKYLLTAMTKSATGFLQSKLALAPFFSPQHAQGKGQRQFLHDTTCRKESSSHITQGLWTKSIMSQLTAMIMEEITAMHREIWPGFPIQQGKDSHHNTQYCKRWPFIGCNYTTKTGDSLFIPNIGLGLTPLCHQSLSQRHSSQWSLCLGSPPLSLFLIIKPIHILSLPEDPVSFIHKNTAVDGTWSSTSPYVTEWFLWPTHWYWYWYSW